MVTPLDILRGLLHPTLRPIGIDFGTEMLRVAQICGADNELQLRGAAAVEVPAVTRNNHRARFVFLTSALKKILREGRFAGRDAVLSLPGWLANVRSITLPQMTQDKVETAVRHAISPANPNSILLRYWIAGPMLMTGGKTGLHVLAYWADHDAVNEYMDAVAAAGLRVRAIHVEANALLNCFSHVHRRARDAHAVNLLVDVGADHTRIAVARGSHLLDADRIGIGGRAFDAAVATATGHEVVGSSLADARLLRMKYASGMTAEARDARDVTPDALITTPGAEVDLASRVAEACNTVAARLADALLGAKHSHDLRFPQLPVNRILLVGGAASQRWLGKLIAERLHLPGQIADPVLRLRRTDVLDAACGIDRRRPQPMWSVAAGLSFAEPRLFIAESSTGSQFGAAA